MGWPVFGLPPWKKFSAARSRSSRSAQEDGCSSLPCPGVLSFRSEAREASGSETARVHHAHRWRGRVAARGARAAAGEATDHRALTTRAPPPAGRIMTTSTTAVSTQREPELFGQTVVVIGGSAGIGLETARRARAEGASLILTGRNPERLEQAAR